jgi:hypothetical protein
MIAPLYERFTHTSAFALGAVDLFAAARTTKGQVTAILGEVDFLLTERLTPPAVTYEPPLEFVSWINRGGFFLFSGDTRSPSRSGTVQLAPGRYKYRVESDYYQVLESEIDWPPPQVYDASKDLQLAPGPAYPFPNLTLKQRKLGVTILRGSLFGPGGKANEGVQVEFMLPPGPAFANRFAAFPRCETDRNGNWIISLIDVNAGPTPSPDPFATINSVIRVHESTGDYDVPVTIKLGEEKSLRQTALRGSVIRSGGAPFPGVRITTSVGAGESITRSDGQWFFYFELRQANGPVTVTATTPDGRSSNTQTQIVSGATGLVPAIDLS